MTRTGAVAGRVGSVAVYDGFDLSPDDSRIAAAQVGATGTDIWITDLPDGSRFRAAFNTASSNDTAPIWAGDNATLTYLSTGTRGLALKRADLVGNIAPTELVSSPRNQLADSWNKSRDELIFEGYGSGGDGDLFVLHTRDGHVERLVINSGANDRAGRLSPDDRWIAYMTDESGQDEIWVAAYPSGQPRRRVSQGGGSHPEWNSAGSELFYISASGDLTAVTFRGARESGIVTERPLRLFAMPGPVDYVAGGHNMFQSARDGKRFLVAAKSQSGDAPPLRFIVNWRSLLSGN